MAFLIKASQTSMYDRMSIYSNNTQGVLDYLEDMGISMYDSSAREVTGYSSEYYIDLDEVKSTYCSTGSSFTRTVNGVDAYQNKYMNNNTSFFDCFLASDGMDMATAYLKVNDFNIMRNGVASTFEIALRGTRPHFNVAHTITASTRLQVTSNKFTLGTTDLTKFSSLDGTKPPLRYICVLVGGGGGGGGTVESDSAGGGGGGGTIIGYTQFVRNYTYNVGVGTGGSGGKYSDSNKNGYGSEGGKTSISRTLNGTNYHFSAKGGRPGRGDGEATDWTGKGGGGFGGSVTNNLNGAAGIYWSDISSISGGDGGGGDLAGGGMDGEYGENIEQTTVRCTNRNTDAHYLLEVGGQNGGTCYDGYGGGGGASALGPGGDGGKPGNSNNAGGKTPSSGYGGGGGGATYIFLTYISGGSGKPGLVKLYY